MIFCLIAGVTLGGLPPLNTKLVRILQEIPAKSGRHFRFYSVVLHQRDPDCLIVR